MNPKNLRIEVGIISFLFIGLNNAISYYYNKDFFIFSNEDALTYDYLAVNINNSSESFIETMDRLGFGKLGYDDYGQILLVSFVYKIWASNLMLNIYYLFLAIFGCRYLYLLCLNFMSNKYAYFSSLLFYTSSYMLFYNSSGLKESQMLFLIILSFYHFYVFLRTSQIKSLVFSFLFLFFLMFFRPAISFIIFASMVIGYLKIKNINSLIVVILSVTFVSILFLNNYVQEQQQIYLSNDYDQIIETNKNEGMIKGGVGFTILVNSASSLIGHFPTIVPDSEPALKSMYSGALIIKNFLSLFYLIAIYFIFKFRYWILLPVLFYPLIESASLVYLFEALELRKSLPHYPLIYILIFWCLYILEQNKTSLLFNELKNKYFNLYLGFSTLLIVYWNLR
jgi:hypothetical protein